MKSSFFYFLIQKIKKNLISIFILLFIFFLVLYSKENMIAVKDGLNLWINNVVPSLFPFFIATEILCNTNIITILGKILKKPISKIFNVPGEGAFALIMGTISGYPSGAKIVANLKSQEILTLEEAERLIAFTNNSGPLFIIGTVGVSLLGNLKLGYILLISHIISCLIVGIIFRNWKKSSSYNYRFYENGNMTKLKGEHNNENIRKTKNSEASKSLKISDFGEILGDSIRKSTITITNIGGFIVVFSVIISILNSSGFFEFTELLFEKLNFPKDVGNSIISGFIELTNGVKIISQLPLKNINISIISFLIGFGGLSVLFQVYSIISKENISIKPYFYGKLLQGVISFFITFILL